MKSAALGFRVHSGWAAMIALAVSKGSSAILIRERVHLVNTFTYKFRQPYHTAEKMPLCRRPCIHFPREIRITTPRFPSNSGCPGKPRSTGIPHYSLRPSARFGPRASAPRENLGVSRADSHSRWRTFPRSFVARDRPPKSSLHENKGTRPPERSVAHSANQARQPHAPNRRTRPPARRTMDARRKIRLARCLASPRRTLPLNPRFFLHLLCIHHFLCLLYFIYLLNFLPPTPPLRLSSNSLWKSVRSKPSE